MLRARRLVAGALAGALLVLVPATAATAAQRGQGTMLVSDGISCQGAGNDPSVTLPFSLWFTGFAPGASGTVSGYTQPGGELVATREATIGDDGTLCLRVTGDAPTGQYKIVYDFGSGTGKQKVIFVRNPHSTAPPSGTDPAPTPSLTTETATETVTETSTATETVTATETLTDPASTPPVTTTVTTTETGTVTSTATQTITTTATTTLVPSSAPAPTGPTDVEGGLVLTPVDPLAPTGGVASGLVPWSLLLLAVGAALVVLTGAGAVSRTRRRH